jgi:hypothetical protein
MKKKIFTILVIISLLLIIVPGTAQADSGLVVSPSLAMINFPNSIIISISAQSDVNITDIRLHYTVERKSYAQVIAEAVIAFTPAKKVDTQWVLDMRKVGTIPSGTVITYWLTVTDASNSQVETLPIAVNFNDSRFDWKTIQEGQVTIHWYTGNESFGNELMSTAQQVLTKLAENTGAGLESAVDLYIYASSADLQGAMINPQEWMGGVTLSEYNTIAIGIGTTEDELEWSKRAICHELTHMVLFQVTSNPYNYIPLWLNEGMAMFSEGSLEVAFTSALSKAEANHAFLSVQSLCSPFPADYNQAILAYAESYKIVSYLIKEYGRDKIFDLLNVFRQASGYNEALLKVYGFDMEELNTLWRTEPAMVHST